MMLLMVYRLPKEAVTTFRKRVMFAVAPGERGGVEKEKKGWAAVDPEKNVREGVEEEPPKKNI